jgi:hypothetical protein
MIEIEKTPQNRGIIPKNRLIWKAYPILPTQPFSVSVLDRNVLSFVLKSANRAVQNPVAFFVRNFDWEPLRPKKHEV